jgi:putative transposase
MARLPRIDLAGIPQHVIQRGNNRSACFFADADYAFYLECLSRAAARYECAIHAYVLMTNHVHLLVTPAGVGLVAHMMQSIGRSYVRYINGVYKRTGTLWEGRYKSSLIDSERYLLSCYRYIELNPVRAGLVHRAEDYRWSSYTAHVRGEPNNVINDHPLYLAMGKDAKERMLAYRALFSDQMDDDQKLIRREVNRSGVLGGERFKDEIEAALARRVRPGKAGRPKVQSDPSENRAKQMLILL